MSCLIDVDHDAVYEELFCKIVKGKKEWRCGECNNFIHKGTEHEVFVGKIDDRINTHRTCLPCMQIRNKFLCSWTYEGVYADISDAIESDPNLENCTLMLATEAEYNRLVDRIPYLADTEEEEDE